MNEGLLPGQLTIIAKGVPSGIQAAGAAGRLP
jgi:hypothetical protein